jgi:hypothetical protein
VVKGHQYQIRTTLRHIVVQRAVATTAHQQQLPYDVTQMSATWAQRNLDNRPFNGFHRLHLFGADYDHNGKLEATLMFDFLPVGGNVVAPFDGQIREVTDQAESCDTEMYLLPTQENEDPTHAIGFTRPRHSSRGISNTRGYIQSWRRDCTLGKWQCKERFCPL